jgi:hypothetical protein
MPQEVAMIAKVSEFGKDDIFTLMLASSQEPDYSTIPLFMTSKFRLPL